MARGRRRFPERLLIAPQDIRTTDPTVAAEISANVFSLAGQSVLVRPGAAFTSPDGTEAWRVQLAEFGWLRHLRRTSDPTARERARAIVDVFITTLAAPSADKAWTAEAAARRTISWLSQSPVILTTADRDFYLRFLRALTTHATYLTAGLNSSFTGTARLTAAIALANYALCCTHEDGQQTKADRRLAGEIAAQVLPDGGHVSRNPQVVLDLLLDLLPLRQAYAARNLEPPSQMVNAIDRMMPLLRLLRHGDGAIALFNGMGATAPELVATVLAYDDLRAQPLENARYAGYQRLSAGSTLAIVDVGTPPPLLFSQRSHAGCLSFELSTGHRRLVVNCGHPAGANAETSTAVRSSAAHSTLLIEDASSCRFFAGGDRLLGPMAGAILDGPKEVEVRRTRSSGETVLTASHDGFVPAFGLRHARLLRLSDDGATLIGRDSLEAGIASQPVRDRAFSVRFHLHPMVQVTQAGAFEATLELTNGERWLFHCSQQIAVAASVFFADARGTRPTLQIVICGTTAATTSIDWSFSKVRQAVQA